MLDDSIAKFQKFLSDNQIPTDEPIDFGRLVKYDDPFRKSQKSKRAPAHYYIAFSDDKGSIWAKCGSHDTSVEISNPIFKSYGGSALTPQEILQMKENIERGQQEILKEWECKKYEGSIKASNVWEESKDIDESFQFEWLNKKKLPPTGIRYNEQADCLIIPAFNDQGQIQSYQRVFRDGEKKNASGCVMRNCFVTIGEVEKSNTIYVGESWATCMPAYLASGQACVATFGTGHQAFVGAILKDSYPDKLIVMLKDKGDAGDKAANEWKQFVKTEIFEASDDDFSTVYVKHGLDQIKIELKLTGLPLVNGSDSLNSPNEPIDWVVENFLDNESVNIIYAAGGTGKSLLAQQLAVNLENATPFMDRVIPKQRRVLYIDCEMGRKRYDRRLKKCNELNGRPLKLPTSLCIDDMIKKGIGVINIFEKSWQNRLDQVFNQFDVIIIDSFNKSSELPQEATRELHWRTIYRWLYKWRDSKCIIFVHHTNKSGEMAGTQHIFNDSDNSIEILKVKNPENRFQIAVNMVKGRDVPFHKCNQFTCTWLNNYDRNGGWKVTENTTEQKK